MLRLYLALCAGAPHAPSPRWEPFSQGMAQHQVSLHWSLWCAVPRGRCNNSVWRNNCAQRLHISYWWEKSAEGTCQILLALNVHQLIKVLWLKNPIFYLIYIRCFVEISNNFASLFIHKSKLIITTEDRMEVMLWEVRVIIGEQ